MRNRKIIFTMKESAGFAGVDKRTLYIWKEKGWLQTTIVDGKTMVERKHLMEAMRKHATRHSGKKVTTKPIKKKVVGGGKLFTEEEAIEYLHTSKERFGRLAFKYFDQRTKVGATHRWSKDLLDKMKSEL